MASARSASLNGSLGPGQSPERGPEAEPLVGGHRAKPPELKAFLSIFIQIVAKSRGFKRKLAPCLRETASHSQG